MEERKVSATRSPAKSPKRLSSPPLAARVRVAVRVRPPAKYNGEESPLLCVTEPASETRDDNPVLLFQFEKMKKFFRFDHIFSSEAVQTDVYKEALQPLLASFLHGFNVTVLAYGQTGSGKTYTMGGSNGPALESVTDNGLIPHFLRDLFKALRSDASVRTTAKVSFLEIYCDEIRDLLADGGEPARGITQNGIRQSSAPRLTIHEDDQDVWVKGLQQTSVKTVDEALRLLQAGRQRQTTGSHALNDHSSRSHAVYTLNVSRVFGNKIKQAKLTFVDLAGSERVKKTLLEGQGMKEGSHINIGLLALGNVINALGSRQRMLQRRNSTGVSGRRSSISGSEGLTSSGPAHVPYRSSKLTRLLRDALGGNSVTLFIACISPDHANSNETLCTLQYANRARSIQNKAMTNTQEAVPEDFDGDQLSVTESEREIIYLREQLAALKLQLEKAQASAKAEAARGSSDAHTQNETETASKLCLRSRSKRRLRITPLALDIPEFSGNEASNDRQKSEQHDGIVNTKTQQFKRDGFPVKLSNTMKITMKTPDELVARPTNNTSPQIEYVCCDELNNDESPMQNCNYLPDKDDTKNSRIEHDVPQDRSSTDNQAMVDKSTQYEPPHCLLHERKIPVDYVVLSPSQIFREIYYQKQKELARAPFPWPHQRCTDASKSQSRNRKTCLTPIPQSEEASNQQHSKVSKSGDALRYILMCTQQLIENSPELGDQDCKAENDDLERNGDAYSPLSFDLFVSRVTALCDQRRRQQEYIHRLTQRFRHLQNLLGAADVNTQLIELSKYKLDYQQHSLQQHLEECEDIVANRLWMRLQNREMAIDTFADNWSEKMAEVYLSDDQYEACVSWHTHRDDDTFFHDHILPFVLNGWISVTSADLENEQLWLAL